MIEEFEYDEFDRTIIVEWYDPDRNEYDAPMIVAKDVSPAFGPRLAYMLNYASVTMDALGLSHSPPQLA